MMTTRDAAAIPLSIGSVTYNWWHHIIEGIPVAGAYFIPVAGAVLIVLQIIYYWKMIHKK